MDVCLGTRRGMSLDSRHLYSRYLPTSTSTQVRATCGRKWRALVVASAVTGSPLHCGARNINNKKTRNTALVKCNSFANLYNSKMRDNLKKQRRIRRCSPLTLFIKTYILSTLDANQATKCVPSLASKHEGTTTNKAPVRA